VPVHGKYIDASGLFPANSARQAEEKHDAKHEQANRDVSSVQTDERVVGRSKKVSGDGETVLIDQPVPFLAGAKQKETPKSNREEL
jgi:hypothetical protein